MLEIRFECQDCGTELNFVRFVGSGVKAMGGEHHGCITFHPCPNCMEDNYAAGHAAGYAEASEKIKELYGHCVGG